jgi:hypothetical protein
MGRLGRPFERQRDSPEILAAGHVYLCPRVCRRGAIFRRERQRVKHGALSDVPRSNLFTRHRTRVATI